MTQEYQRLIKQAKKLGNILEGQVQKAKVDYSRQVINQLQVRDEFAKDKKDIISYHTSLNQSNRYIDIDKFWSVMLKSPKKWDKKFYYVTSGGGSDEIYRAAKMAIDIARKQIQGYPDPALAHKNNRPGHPGMLLDSMRFTVDGSPTSNPLGDISSHTGGPVFEMATTTPYASTAEASSYFSAQSGLLYYAASRVQKKFPSVGVLFYYSKADSALGLGGFGHKYDVPVVRIGPPDSATGKWGRPGTRRKKRQKFRRALERNYGR